MARLLPLNTPLYIILVMILYEHMKPIEHVLFQPICVLSHLMCACKHCNAGLHNIAYGPPMLFLRPARAPPIVENAGKARPRLFWKSSTSTATVLSEYQVGRKARFPRILMLVVYRFSTLFWETVGKLWDSVSVSQKSLKDTGDGRSSLSWLRF